jgi:osmotically inducible lipoprotein OsmB
MRAFSCHKNEENPMKPEIALSFITLLTLAACGDTQGERALSGAAIGAGGGAAAGALMGNPAAGALVGGAAGAATGAFTSPNQIDLSR